MPDPTLLLRDIHQPPAPSWWPPAPGWWLLAATVLAVGAALAWWRARRRRRAHTRARLFDAAIAQAPDAPARVAAMSELLRRAARRRDAAADRLQGEAWLAFLDDADATRPFSQGAGRLLLDGGFRRDVDEAELDALQTLARARFLRWMAAK